MTIIEAIKEVLRTETVGLTSREIYEKIISKNLYVFPAANPPGVVNNIIRRHCLGLDFPTANVVKLVLCQDLVQVKMRNFPHSNLP